MQKKNKNRLVMMLFMAVISLSFIKICFGNNSKDDPLTLEEYNKRVARQDKPVLVFFHASWCMVCEKVKPTMVEIENEYSTKLEVLRVDTEKDKEVAAHFEIDALPVIMLYKKGTRQWIHVGMIDKGTLEGKINESVN